ncbi:MAG: DUF6937 domain-containing protein [Pleomorphochaeta sp.]
MDIFGNQISKKDENKAIKSYKKNKKKFGDKEDKEYHLSLISNEILSNLYTYNLILSDKKLKLEVENPVIIGNIRMGFGHYRIALAMCSAAKYLNKTPIWMDLASFGDYPGSKLIAHQNTLYSFGSRLSQKNKLFNKYYWEPLNSVGFAKLSYNAKDLYNAKFMTQIFNDLDKDIPFVGTHAWTAQVANEAKMTKVVNAIPDNWPMALHFAPGALHTVQTHSAYLGYRTLRNMGQSNIVNLCDNDIKMVGHYIDHELVSNIKNDCNQRIKNAKQKTKPVVLLTVGGAGAQVKLYKNIINYLKDKAIVLINVGDHKNVFNYFINEFKDIERHTSYNEAKNFFVTDNMHIFYNEDIFSAVYSTNILMRLSDLLITKPSELSFYPIPKLLLKRVGGHEKWGAIHSSEIGDGTYECETYEQTINMLKLLIENPECLINMNTAIINANKIGVYDGAYKVIEEAFAR